MIEITQEMKNWFGQGEQDVDLMLRMGVLTESFLRECLNVLTDSPWFGKMYD
jgi:hypothetical protein